MRGTIFFQTGKLAEVLYKPGLSKPDQKATGYLANAKTIEKYRDIWNAIGEYAKQEFGLKDLQNLTAEHIQAYMEQKVDDQVSEQYLEFTSSLIGKLEIALTKLNAQFFLANAHYAATLNRTYDFSIRKSILGNARKNHLVIERSDDPEYCRAYDNPQALIAAIQNPLFKLAATIQLESGARLEGVKRIDNTLIIKQKKLNENTLSDCIEYTLIDEGYCEVPQLQGTEYDALSAAQKGRMFDVEKGGKPGILLLSIQTYDQLKAYLLQNHYFKIDITQYREALKDAALMTQQPYQGTHGLRWNFAQERFYTIQAIGGLTYEQALQQVSWEMKHERASVTEHYLR